MCGIKHQCSTTLPPSSHNLEKKKEKLSQDKLQIVERELGIRSSENEPDHQERLGTLMSFGKTKMRELCPQFEICRAWSNDFIGEI
jgi:hypothetical protein